MPITFSQTLRRLLALPGIAVALLAATQSHADTAAPPGSASLASQAAPSPAGAAQSAAEVSRLADTLLAHLESVDVGVRAQRRLPLDRLPDLGFGAAREQADFSGKLLEQLNRIDLRQLPHDKQILAGILRQYSESGRSAAEDFWYQFPVTPYAGGILMQVIHQEMSTTGLSSAEDRARMLKVLRAYPGMIDTLRGRITAQAARGFRVSRLALPGVITTLRGLRDSIKPLCASIGERASAGHDGDAELQRFKQEAASIGNAQIIPAYDKLLAVFDDAYTRAAPAEVGMRSYAGGPEAYRRRIQAETGLALEPRAIHELGLKRVAELENKLASIRARVKFKGDKQAFHQALRTDARFLAHTPDEVKARYDQHMARITPLLPKYFLVLPTTGYGVRRLPAAAEPGMTYGYYAPPSAGEPLGIYYFNGSSLDKRSLATSAHIIYHELLPGHHLRLALADENKSQHPLLTVMSFGAFEEGWAEYAAELAVEMGAVPDPYDQYGHYVSQEFLASRLVVDTGMNDLGWSRDKAQAFMREHTFESDTQIATETLRYSTDIPAQALDYRLGYETIMDARAHAQQRLGKRFDMRAFNTAVSNNGAMPLNVLKEHIEWFIEHSAAESPRPAKQ